MTKRIKKTDISDKHNKSFFFNDFKNKLRRMQSTYKKIPISSILANFEEVENYFKSKSYLKPSKFWGYGIGNVDNGSERYHENSYPETGVYFTIFRLHNKKLLFEYFEVDGNGKVHDDIIEKLRLKFENIIEVKTSNAPRNRKRVLIIQTTLFPKPILVPSTNNENANYYKEQILLLKNGSSEAANGIISKLDSQYVRNKIALIKRTEDSDVAIGLSKDLIETVCKTILNSKSVQIESDWKVARFIKECNNILVVDLSGISNPQKVQTSIRQVLNGMGTTIQGITEIRNEQGTGHGRDDKFIQLKNQYSKLISNSVFEICNFYLEHFKDDLN